jgi:hypothetical protein
MAIDYADPVSRNFVYNTRSYSWRNGVPYALGLGLGSRSGDRA